MMKKMNKVFSAFLAIVMLLSCMTGTALAAEGGSTLWRGDQMAVEVAPGEDGYTFMSTYGGSVHSYEISHHFVLADGYAKQQTQLFMMLDASGDETYTWTPNGLYNFGSSNYELVYCCDVDTGYEHQAHYKRTNLEDSTYFTENEAQHIRAVILNSYPNVSIEEMKRNLAADGFENADKLTKSDIITATQAAIWYYANGGEFYYNGTYDVTNTPRWGVPAHDYTSEMDVWWNTKTGKFSADAEVAARIDALIDYLKGLDKVIAADEQVVVSAVEVLEAVPSGVEDGVYSAEIRVDLNNSGSSDSDEMQIKVTVGDREYACQVERGVSSYTFEIEAEIGDVVIAEVSGTQILPTGAYFYEPKGGRGTSQSMVGIAKGATDVYSKKEAKFAVETPAIDKTATELDDENRTNVTLSVSGEAEVPGSDIVCIYFTGIGSYVEDEIGYDSTGDGDDYDFDFVDEAEALSMKVGEINYTAAKIETAEGATSSYAFTAEGAEEATFWLDYYGEDHASATPEAEYFRWTFGENISNYSPAALTYTLVLEKAPAAIGKHDLPTNEIATLYPEGGTPENFPEPDVPYEVRPNALVIDKSVVGLLGNDEMPAGTVFTVTGPNGFNETYTWADFEDGVLTITKDSSGNYLAAGTYTVTEDETSAQVDTYALTVSNNGGEASFENDTDEIAEIEITNRYAPDAGTLKISKTVTGLLEGDEMPATFTVTGPYGYSETFEYADFEGGVLTIENLPVGTYTVVESGAELANYDLVVTNGRSIAAIEKDATAEIAITNAYDAYVGSLTVSKTVLGDNVMPEDAEFQLKDADGKTVASVTWGEVKANGGTYTIENIPVGEYTLVETGAAVETHKLEAVNHEQTVTVERDENAVAETITNTYTEIKDGTLVINKEFTGVDAIAPAISFTVTGPEGYEETFTYGDFVEGQYVLTGLKAGTYTVTEDEESAQIAEFELRVNNNVQVQIPHTGKREITITNKYLKEIGSLTVTKTVAGLEEEAVMAPETLFEVKDASGATVASATWAEFENGSYTFTDLPIGEYTVVETGAEVEGYEGPATVIIYDGSENNTSAEIIISETAAADITNTYKKIETDFYYDVIHAFYYSENGGEYEYVGEGEPVRHGPVQVAPTNAQVFNAEDKSDDFDGDTYDRLDEYATGEVTVTGSLEGKDLVYTVKYYLSDWTKGSLTITKTIKGLDEKAERTLKANLKFRVTGPDGYDETFSYIDDFSSKGKLTIKNLVPGTYSVEEIGADIGGGYELHVISDEEVEVKGSAKATNFRITNEYTSRVYNVWFDGGAHGEVLNPSGKSINGVWRSNWHNYGAATYSLRKALSADDYDWAASQLKPGTPIYKYGSTNLYPNLVENPEIEDGTHMVMYTLTWAQWNEHGKDMGISAPDLKADDGWKTNAKFYVVGADEVIPFTTMADAIDYMNEEVEPDANGFYNVLFMPEYKRNVPMGGGDDDPIIPVIPNDPTEIPDEDVPTTEIPDEEPPKSDIPEEDDVLTELEEEEVPLVELPDTDVPKTGDDMMLYMLMAAASAAGLGYLLVTGKTREEEIAE